MLGCLCPDLGTPVTQCRPALYTPSQRLLCEHLCLTHWFHCYSGPTCFLNPVAKKLQWARLHTKPRGTSLAVIFPCVGKRGHKDLAAFTPENSNNPHCHHGHLHLWPLRTPTDIANVDLGWWVHMETMPLHAPKSWNYCTPLTCKWRSAHPHIAEGLSP